MPFLYSSWSSLLFTSFVMWLTLGLIACQKQGSGVATEVVYQPVEPPEYLKLYGDIFRKWLSDPSFLQVAQDLGPTVITVHDFPYKSPVAVANVQPWSSWWYPKKETTLFSVPQGLSPLQKYDLVRKSRFPQAKSAADFEKANYNASALPWEGLCDAWALASLYSPEPTHSVHIALPNGRTVNFSSSDLKALLLKTYESTIDSQLQYYGQKFTGDATSWIYPDLFPDQFHRFLEVQLFQNKQPFIMDHYAGVEVWNVPVFKANYVMDRVADNPNAVAVRAWIYSAESLLSLEKDQVGTKVAVREYNYILEGKRNDLNALVIESGYWTTGPTGINSRNDHPDYVYSSSKVPFRKSLNPEIDVALIDEIISSAP